MLLFKWLKAFISFSAKANAHTGQIKILMTGGGGASTVSVHRGRQNR